tara:strand:- start:5618 stop:6319 length:702 start_codon:yes stop_codon:yes gene_type:complete
MITAIIPARSGSKRLPDKNIKLLCDKPLIFHTIDSVLNHPEISSIIFTTDSREYINLVKAEYDDKLIYEYRPSEYATDHSKVYDELKRLIKKGLVDTQWYMLCLPTCPLRNHDIVRGLLDYWNIEKKPVFSANEYDFPAQFAFSIDNDNLNWIPMMDDSPMISGNTRSQDIQKSYRPNGAIYLQHADNIDKKTLYIDASAYLMNCEDSIDIDTELDFVICEHILSKKEKYNGR